jgi:hypothetical protein
MTSRERRAPRARPPQSASASTKSSGSPAPSAPPMANRRRQDEQDDPADDSKPRNKRLPKDKDKDKDRDANHKGKSKLVEEISAFPPPSYNAHDDDEEGSVTRCICGSGKQPKRTSCARWLTPRRRGGYGQLHDPVRAVLGVAARRVYGCRQR